MLFNPEKRAKETRKRLHNKYMEKSRQRTLKRREEYLKAKEKGKVDEFFANLEKNLNNPGVEE